MLTGIAVFLLLVIALLVVPITLKFQVSWKQSYQGNIKLLWLFGLVHIQLPPFESKISSEDGEELEQKITHVERSPRKKRNVFAVIRQTSFRQRSIKFISDIWHAIQKKDVNLRVCLGLGDPADTGQLWALMGPVAGMLSNAKEVLIEIKPDFFDATFELDSAGSIRIIPLQLIYLTIGLILSPPIWQGIKQLRTVE